MALNLLGSKLSRLQTQLPSDLQINCEHLSKRIAKLSVKATSVKTPTTTQTQEDPKNLIPFFQGKGKNLHGFSLDEILRFNDKEMEAHHNFIQWIFPTKQKSGSNASAPILNEGLIKAMRADPLVQKNLVLSFEKMLDYYGLKLEGSKVVKASNFSSRKKYWTINGGHNLLRMTRIINSMATLGQRELAKSYYDCIADIATKKEVSSLGSSPGIWENCMQSRALHIM